MYIGEIAALVTALVWAVSPIYTTRASRILGGYTLNTFRVSLSAVLYMLIIAVWKGSPLPFWAPASEIGYLAFSAVIGLVFGDTAHIVGYKLLGARQGSLLDLTAPVFTAILACIVLGESLSAQTIIGIGIILFGIALCQLTRVAPNDLSAAPGFNAPFIKGILLCLFAALCQAIAYISAKLGMTTLDPIDATTVRMTVAVVVLWLGIILRRRVQLVVRDSMKPEALRPALISSFLGPFCGVWLSLAALKYTQAGIAATLIATSPLLVIPISAKLEGEAAPPKAVTGTIIALIGVALLFLE